MDIFSLKKSHVFAKCTVYSIPTVQQSLWHTVQIFSCKDTIVQWFWKKGSQANSAYQETTDCSTPTHDKEELETTSQTAKLKSNHTSDRVLGSS